MWSPLKRQRRNAESVVVVSDHPGVDEVKRWPSAGLLAGDMDNDVLQ